MNKLLERLAAIRAEAQALLDAADADNGGTMTDEQAAQFDALLAERETVEANIERRKAVDGMGDAQPRAAAPAAPHSGAAPAGSGARSRDSRMDDPLRGFSDIADFATAVQAANPRTGQEPDERLRLLGAPSNFHKEGGSSDGYNVPPAIRQEVWALVHEDEGLLAAVEPEPTLSNEVKLGVDDSTPWGSTGVQANWVAEGNQLTASRLQTEGRNVPLHKMHAYVLATEELLEDAPRLVNRLTVQSGAAIRWKAGDAIVNGDGVGKPLGWNSSGSLITVAKESGQAADTIVASNVVKMYARMIHTGARNPFWLVNPTALPQLMLMTIGDTPVWTPPNGLIGGPGGFLLGLPVRLSEYAQEVGDAGDIQLVAPNGYYAATKASGIKFDTSMHLFFDYDIEAFKWTFRMGGQPYLDAPIARAKGSTTMSHFVTLAARA